MRRMFTEEAFNSLGNDVDELKNKHLYIHQISAYLIDETHMYSGVINFNIINTSSDKLTTSWWLLSQKLENYIYTCVYDSTNNCIGQISAITGTIEIYLNYNNTWTLYEFDSLNADYSSDTVIQLI